MNERREYNWVKGNGKESPKFGADIISFSLLMEDLERLVKNNPEKHKKGYVQLEIVRKMQPDQYGNTHGIRENSYTPKKKDDGDDLPF